MFFTMRPRFFFKTTNEGQSWEIISPDLTTNDKEKQKSSGGPITKDNTSVEYYCTIFALAESYHDPHILWVGTDDGLVHITKDGGKKWENITPKEMPKWSLISSIEPSRFDPAAAYLAVDRHELDDFKPYIYKTDNFGQSWKLIVNGLPQNTFVRVVREDPKRKGLLYCGTETGVFVSFDDGSNWQSLQLNLPVVPIHDMAVKDDDLVVATHGRSFWILDDLTPLHQINEKVANSRFYLFKPRDAYRMRGGGDFPMSPLPNVGQNPPAGSVIFYYFRENPETEVTLEFLDSAGKIIKKFTSQAAEDSEFEGLSPARLPAEAGMNRFIWDMRYPDAERVPGAIIWSGTLRGPVAPPGKYQVRLRVGEETMTQTWEWKKAPRLSTSQEELEEQFAFLIKIRDKISEVNRAINEIRSLKNQIEALSKQVKDNPRSKEITEAGRILVEKLKAVEDVLIQSKSKSNQDPLNYPIMLDNKLAALAAVVASADSRPTDGSYQVFKELSEKADAELAKLRSLIEADLSALNKMVQEAGIPAIIVKIKK